MPPEECNKVGKPPNRNLQKHKAYYLDELPPIAEMMRPFEKQISNVFEFDLSIRNAYGERPNHASDISDEDMKTKKEIRKKNRQRDTRAR